MRNQITILRTSLVTSGPGTNDTVVQRSLHQEVPFFRNGVLGQVTLRGPSSPTSSESVCADDYLCL